MTVDYTAKGDSFVAGKPRVWSETRILDLAGNTSFDLTPDGKRVAALMGGEETEVQKPLSHLTILLNFFDELQRRVPARK